MNKETIEKAAKTKPNYTWSNPILTVELSIHTGKDSPQTKTTMKQDAARLCQRDRLHGGGFLCR